MRGIFMKQVKAACDLHPYTLHPSPHTFVSTQTQSPYCLLDFYALRLHQKQKCCHYVLAARKEEHGTIISKGCAAVAVGLFM